MNQQSPPSIGGLDPKSHLAHLAPNSSYAVRADLTPQVQSGTITLTGHATFFIPSCSHLYLLAGVSFDEL
jgi:hypothetical protein